MNWYKDRKWFWGLITQLSCDSNWKIHFVQTDWPRATKNITCFREKPLKRNNDQIEMDWKIRIQDNLTLTMRKPVYQYWKMRAFNHELSSEWITVKRVLGMLVRRFGILWKAIGVDLLKVPTVYYIICKLHNIWFLYTTKSSSSISQHVF